MWHLGSRSVDLYSFNHIATPNLGIKTELIMATIICQLRNKNVASIRNVLCGNTYWH